jgi:hypothetical protein
MGQDWRPNKAFSTELLIAYLEAIKFKISDAVSSTKLNNWLVTGVYSVITYVVSLRGSEGIFYRLGRFKKARSR